MLPGLAGQLGTVMSFTKYPLVEVRTRSDSISVYILGEGSCERLRRRKNNTRALVVGDLAERRQLKSESEVWERHRVTECW